MNGPLPLGGPFPPRSKQDGHCGSRTPWFWVEDESKILLKLWNNKNVLVEHVLHPIVFAFNIFHILDQRRQRILKPLKKDNVLPAAIVVLSLKEIESIRNQSKRTWTSSGEASLPLSSSNKVSILSPLVARNLLKKKCASACHWKLFRSLHVISILKGCQVSKYS